MFRRNASGLTTIVRKGDTLNGKTVGFIFPPSIDSQGIVCPIPATTPTPATFTHVFGDGGPLTPMYTIGTPSPSGNNSLSLVLSAVVNDAGLAAYTAFYNGANIERGIYTRSPGGAVTTHLIRNATAPRGGTITNIAQQLTINESGQIANIIDVDGVSLKSIVRVGDGSPVELVRPGDFAVDGITKINVLSSTSSFTTTPIPIINNVGQVAFPAQYIQPASRLGVFVADTTGIRMVSPGNLPQGNATSMNVVGLSDAGKVAFTTEFFGGSDPVSAVMLADTSGQTVVALEDTATPTPGKFFRSFITEATAFNNNGQLAFMAELSNTANGAAAGRGLYFYDQATGLQEIARSGDPLGGSTIDSLFFYGNVSNAITLQSPDTSNSGLNASGKVAFAYTLTDGQSGIATWTRPVPGDYNGDGSVTSSDYTAWRSSFSSNSPSADGNKNGTIDAADYIIWRNAMSSGAALTTSDSSATIPEPAAITLLLAQTLFLAACGAFGRRP